jgi:hypothetical protein
MLRMQQPVAAWQEPSALHPANITTAVTTHAMSLLHAYLYRVPRVFAAQLRSKRTVRKALHTCLRALAG